MVDALEVSGLEPPAVGFDHFQMLVLGQQLTAEEEAVERPHLVTLREQHRHERGTDVATGTGHENALHGTSFLTERSGVGEHGWQVSEPGQVPVFVG